MGSIPRLSRRGLGATLRTPWWRCLSTLVAPPRRRARDGGVYARVRGPGGAHARGRVQLERAATGRFDADADRDPRGRTPPPGRAHGPWSAPSVTAASRAPEPLRAARGWHEAVTAAAGSARAIIEVTGSEDFRLRVERASAAGARSSPAAPHDLLAGALTYIQLAATRRRLAPASAYGEGASRAPARGRSRSPDRPLRRGRPSGTLTSGRSRGGRTGAPGAWATWDTGRRSTCRCASSPRPQPAGFGRPEQVSDRTRPEAISASFATSGRPIVMWTTGAPGSARPKPPRR